MGWLDMRLYSRHSGGTYAPAELMALCQKAGICTAALTDRNTTAGLAEARAAAEALDMVFIPAVELSCTFRGVALALIGYWVDEGAPDLRRIPRSLTLPAAVELVRGAGGVPVLVPGDGVSEHLLSAALEEGPDGLEAFGGGRTPEQTARLCRLAAQKGVAVTCGSGFDGADPLALGGMDCSGGEDEMYTEIIKAGIRSLVKRRDTRP